MTASSAPVLVVGAGPSGLATALTLLRNGIPVRVIDKEPHHRIGERATGLWPRTFEAFHFLDVPEIHEKSTPVPKIREHKPGTLEVNKEFEMSKYCDPTPSIPYNNLRFLGQPALERLLRAHLEKYGCTVELSTELQSFEQHDDSVVAKLVKKVDGEEVLETFEASYLIGSDGAKGVSRKQLGLTFLGETRNELNSVIGDICVEVDGIDREHFHFFGNMACNFLSLRPEDDIAPDGFQFLLAMKDQDPHQLVADEKLLFKSISDMIGREVNVRKVVFLSAYRPNVRMVNKFGYGRVFVVGDAAHVHSPTGGQGLNTCVQDAVNLGWKLSLVYKGLSAPTLLDSYDSERLPVIAEMLNITTGILVRAQKSDFGRVWHRDRKLTMLGVNYRSSPIVIEQVTKVEPVNAYGNLDESVLIAGDRAPDAPGLTVVHESDHGHGEEGAETRLFDLFKVTYHTVLVFCSDVAFAGDIIDASRLSSYPTQLVRTVVVLPQGAGVLELGTLGAEVVVDQAGYAYRAYLAERGERKVVVVRPDGVVGAIVRGVEGMKAYFEKIFL